MRTTVAKVVALGLIIAACSSGAEETTTTTTTTITPSTTTSTSTTILDNPNLDISPINGLEVDDPTLLERRVLGVKIDNHRSAIPQSGIENADMVIEIMVEGITRFLTVWHQSDSEYLGPQRSGRPTDTMLMAALNEPTFAISGAQRWVQNLIRSMDVHIIGEVRPATFRIPSRPAPHNLYVNTMLLREYADEQGYPDEPPLAPLWEFGPIPETAEEVAEVSIDFPGTPVIWTWDEGSGTWLRSAYREESFYLVPAEEGQEGEEVEVVEDELHRVGFPVLVALFTEQYIHESGGRPRGLPSSLTTGSGEAYVFAEGKVIPGTWERETEQEWFTLLDTEGNPILVPPGQAWISLVPSTRGLTYE